MTIKILEIQNQYTKSLFIVYTNKKSEKVSKHPQIRTKYLGINLRRGKSEIQEIPVTVSMKGQILAFWED